MKRIIRAWCILILSTLHLEVCAQMTQQLASRKVYREGTKNTTSASALSRVGEYCALYTSSEYDNKLIKTTALLYIPALGKPRVDGDSDYFFYSQNCNNRDYFANAEGSLKEIHRILGVRRDLNRPSLFTVTFNGRISSALIPRYGHLGWLRAEIKVDKVISAKRILYSNMLPNFDESAPLSEAGIALKYLNAELMLSFFGSDGSTTHPFLYGATVVVDDKKIAREDLREPRWKTERGIAVSISNVQKDKDIWQVKGGMTRTNNDGSVLPFNYENIYVLENGSSWKLLNVKISKSHSSRN